MQEDNITAASVVSIGLLRIVALAHFTALQAWYGRLFPVVVLTLLTLFGVAEGFAAMQVIDGDLAAAALLTSLIRLLSVALLMLHIGLMSGPGNGIDATTASLDLSPATLLAGQWLGYAAVGLLLALAGGAVLVPYSGFAPAAGWALSLGMELGLVAAVVLFAREGLRRPVAVVLVGAAFYTLARLFPLLTEIIDRGVAEPTLLRELSATALRALGLLLPRLDGLAHPAWILERRLPGAVSYLAALGGALSYTGFLLILALLDRHLARHR